MNKVAFRTKQFVTDLVGIPLFFVLFVVAMVFAGVCLISKEVA